LRLKLSTESDLREEPHREHAKEKRERDRDREKREKTE
jgi:hypothetical protein